MKEKIKNLALNARTPIVLVIVGALILMASLTSKEPVVFSYNDSTSQINYEVCYTEHSSPMINRCNKQTAYVADLIDYIDADFNYVLNLSHPASGDLKYQLVAIVKATQTINNKEGQFGDAKYALTTEQTKTLNNETSSVISLNSKVDYQYYNDVLSDFRKKAPNAGGELEIALRVTGQLQVEGYDKTIDMSDGGSIIIPLAQQAIDVKSITKTQGSASQDIVINEDKNATIRVAGYTLSAIIFILAAGLAIISRIQYQHKHADTQYEDAVNKLNADYENIIVAVKVAPDVTDVSVNELENFEDLLDVYNAVHMPINFYQTPTTSTFIIINEKIAWRYVIKASSFNK